MSRILISFARLIIFLLHHPKPFHVDSSPLSQTFAFLYNDEAELSEKRFSQLMISIIKKRKKERKQTAKRKFQEQNQANAVKNLGEVKEKKASILTSSERKKRKERKALFTQKISFPFALVPRPPLTHSPS